MTHKYISELSKLIEKHFPLTEKLGQEHLFLGMSLEKAVPALASTGGILHTYSDVFVIPSQVL
jgi:hypothetical protein